MHKALPLLVFIFCCHLTKPLQAQNKYAIIIGINDYYDKPGVLSVHSLKGCVNDAMCVQSLLLSRFYFQKENTTLLLNADATRKNMTDALQNILDKGKAGDAVVFYFCGHGVYIDNPGIDDDPVKKGYNQCICMSDLYAPDYGCFVKDNTLKKLFNKFVEKKMIATTLFDCCFSGLIILLPNPGHHNQYCEAFENIYEGEKLLSHTPIISNRSVDLSKTLTIIDTEIIPRPSETKNSRFAALSACMDNQIAKEIYDESDNPHGAFTKALLSVYQRNKVDLPFSVILKSISHELNHKQLYRQTATYHCDPTRNKNNLIGLPLQSGLLPFKATCIKIDGSEIAIDAGYHSGLAAGNVFTKKTKDGDINITLSQVFADSSVAMVNKATAIGQGDELSLTDSYTTSYPMLKVYVPVMNLSSEKSTMLFNQRILPLTYKKGYMDFHNWWDDSVSYNYVFSNGTDMLLLDGITNEQNRFFLYFALPSDIGNFIKKELKKDQNIELVASPNEADEVLRVSYSPASADNKTPGFVFTYNAPVTSVNQPGYTAFCYNYTQVANLLLNETSLHRLSKNIERMFHVFIRSRTTHWLNEYERK